MLKTDSMFNSKGIITPYQLVSSADSICKQNVGPDLEPNCLTLWWYSWNIFFFKKCFFIVLPNMQIVTISLVPLSSACDVVWWFLGCINLACISRGKLQTSGIFWICISCKYVRHVKRKGNVLIVKLRCDFVISHAIGRIGPTLIKRITRALIHVWKYIANA